MNEILDLFGGSVPAGPPTVPSVTFHPRQYRRCIRGEAPVLCGHCQMNVRRFYDGLPVPGWNTEKDIVILRASYRITQADGSTLDLCVQHAQEHEQRGDIDD